MAKSWAALWTLLVSLAALRAGGLPKGLNILGLLVGAVGIISLIPGLTDLVGSLWLGPNHLVRLAGDRAAAQQPKPGSVMPTAFSTSSFNSKQEYWRG